MLCMYCELSRSTAHDSPRSSVLSHAVRIGNFPIDHRVDIMRENAQRTPHRMGALSDYRRIAVEHRPEEARIVADLVLLEAISGQRVARSAPTHPSDSTAKWHTGQGRGFTQLRSERFKCSARHLSETVFT